MTRSKPLRTLLLSVTLGACAPTQAVAPDVTPHRLPIEAQVATADEASSSSAELADFRQVALGLCEDYPEESRSLKEVRRDLEVMRAVGVNVLRVSIGWDGVEPVKDQYDFAFWDEFVRLAVQEYGIRLIPYVAYTPSWNAPPGTPDAWRAPPRDLAEFGEIMQLLAARYQAEVDSWEIWNEPDNRDYWTGTAQQYARLLQVGAAAVRAGNPRARVVLGGLASDVEFLRELFDEHGAEPHVDVVNLHSYYETWHPDPLESLPEYLQAVKRIVRRHGGNEELWMAEVGYSHFRPEGNEAAYHTPIVYDYEHTPRFQAVMLTRTMALLLAEPDLSLVAWYELKDPRASDAVIGDDHNRHLGVTDADYRPKPSLAALDLIQRLLGKGLRSIDDQVQAVTSSADLVVRSFTTPQGKAVVVAWLQTHRSRASPRRDIAIETGG